MKKTAALTICLIFFLAAVAYADDVDQKLGNMASEQVRTSVRAMIDNGIDPEDAVNMTRLMLQNRFTERQTIRAHQTVMEALKQGLPPEPVMNKANEGAAKQVQAENILRAMEQVRSRYNTAYSQARNITREQSQVRTLGNTMANALAAGLDEEDMLAIMARLQTRTQNMTRTSAVELADESFKTARDMTRLGLPSKEASDLVNLALQNQYTAREMAVMRNAFMTQAGSSNAGEVARQFAHAIQNGASADALGISGSGGSASGSGSAAGSSGSGESGDSGSGNSDGGGAGGPGGGGPGPGSGGPN